MIDQRIQELSDVIYSIDFTCRGVVNASEALEIIQRLCVSANVPGVPTTREEREALVG